MELLNQIMKSEMEICKVKAREAGLVFHDNTLEYIVTNQDMLELSSKVAIPTLYDYWVHDVTVHRNKWMYDAFPSNPYETVINTRPAISFYNQDNADWFNVLIFYHVLGHIDFFQNNMSYRRTWNDDFCGMALADKRLLNKIRAELGEKNRWVDYVVEFARAIDNLVGYYKELGDQDKEGQPEIFGFFSQKIDFYFGNFLKNRYDAGELKREFYYDEIERYNRHLRDFGPDIGEKAFFEDGIFKSNFPEFNDLLKKWKKENQKSKPKDIFEYLTNYSSVLAKKENKWMNDVLGIIRRTSLYLQPQIRTKIANEGWASFWHEKLFMADKRINTHEVDFAKVNSEVVTDPRIGINPYAAGKHLFEFIEDLALKGKLSREYGLLKGIDDRRKYDKRIDPEHGKKAIFETRKYFDDYMLVNFLSDEDFQDFVNKYKLFVIGVRPSRERLDTAEVYIKSKNGKDYRRHLNRMLYHPPSIDFRTKGGKLYLNHKYEGRSLYRRHIKSVLVGLELLWGRPVQLETTEYVRERSENWFENWRNRYNPKHTKYRVLYTCKKKNVTKDVLTSESETEEILD